MPSIGLELAKIYFFCTACGVLYFLHDYLFFPLSRQRRQNLKPYSTVASYFTVDKTSTIMLKNRIF